MNDVSFLKLFQFLKYSAIIFGGFYTHYLAAHPTGHKNSPNASLAQTSPQPTYIVLACNDGDTCRLKTPDNITLKVRLAAIDAPEFSHKKNVASQKGAFEAKDILNEWIQGRRVELKVYGTDTYGRSLVEIFYNGENINLKLVSEGFAEVYKGTPPKGLDIERYQKAENEAKKNSRGIWAQKNYQSPFFYRKSNK